MKKLILKNNIQLQLGLILQALQFVKQKIYIKKLMNKGLKK